MLKELHIENVAVIENVTVAFEKGFLALTGETGAGKSILIDSLNVVLGERASKELIRTGESKAFVSAIFTDLNRETENVLSSLGFDVGEELQISREICQDGKSTARIDGRPVTAAILKEVGRQLVSIHGQHDSQILLLPERHVEFVDAYAETEKELDEYRRLYERHLSIEKEMQSVQGNETEKNRRAELLQYQLNEIDAAELVPGEDVALAEKHAIIRNSAKIASGILGAYGALYDGEESAFSLLSQAVDKLSKAAQYSEKTKEVYDKLSDISYALEDAVSEVRDLKESLTFTQEDADQVEERLDIIYRLKKKYGSSVDEIIAYGEQCRAELNGIVHSDERLRELQEESRVNKEALSRASVLLADKRALGSRKLERQMMEELSSMDMNGVIFAVQAIDCDFTYNGAQQIEFLISANKGEEPKPLSKIASGGELSRVMLAMKSVFSKADTVQTLIFDEIDTGVSGSAAQKIGLKMKGIAKNRQVLCVTHLSQIAALCDVHYKISKHSDDKKTYTNVQKLDYEGRVEELARIISGVNITDAAKENAKEMLK